MGGPTLHVRGTIGIAARKRTRRDPTIQVKICTSRIVPSLKEKWGPNPRQANSIRRVTKMAPTGPPGRSSTCQITRPQFKRCASCGGNNKNSEEQRSESKARLKEGGAQNALASVLLLFRVEERPNLPPRGVTPTSVGGTHRPEASPSRPSTLIRQNSKLAPAAPMTTATTQHRVCRPRPRTPQHPTSTRVVVGLAEPNRIE